MNKKDICELCTEYDVEHKCDNEKECRLIALWKENKELKQKVSNLKTELKETKNKMSYMINPNVIGNRNDMGW